MELLSGKWQEGAVNPERSPLIAPEVNSLAPEAVSTQPLKKKGQYAQGYTVIFMFLTCSHKELQQINLNSHLILELRI